MSLTAHSIQCGMLAEHDGYQKQVIHIHRRSRVSDCSQHSVRDVSRTRWVSETDNTHYIGEVVSLTAHSIQCGMLAEQDGYQKQVIHIT